MSSLTGTIAKSVQPDGADQTTKSQSAERRKKWSFFILADATWVWRVLYPDGTDRAAEVSFRTLEECTADAARYGYVAWPADRERRVGTTSVTA